MIYGILKAIDKQGVYGTITTDEGENLRVKFSDKTTCAYTGEKIKLKINDRLTLFYEKRTYIIEATETHIFSQPDDFNSENMTEQTAEIKNKFAEIHQRDTIYANKWLGIVAREDVTKYGSICLYDGYSDEDYS